MSKWTSQGFIHITKELVTHDANFFLNIKILLCEERSIRSVHTFCHPPECCHTVRSHGEVHTCSLETRFLNAHSSRPLQFLPWCLGIICPLLRGAYMPLGLCKGERNVEEDPEAGFPEPTDDRCREKPTTCKPQNYSCCIFSPSGPKICT